MKNKKILIIPIIIGVVFAIFISASATIVAWKAVKTFRIKDAA